MWGAAANALHVSKASALFGAHLNNFINDPSTKGHLDSPDDQFSIQKGWEWYENYKNKK